MRTDRGPELSFYLAFPLLAPAVALMLPSQCLMVWRLLHPRSSHFLGKGCSSPSQPLLPAPVPPQASAPLKTSLSQQLSTAAFHPNPPFSQPAPIPLPLLPLIQLTRESGCWPHHPDSLVPAGNPGIPRLRFRGLLGSLGNADCVTPAAGQSTCRISTPKSTDEWRRPS